MLLPPLVSPLRVKRGDQHPPPSVVPCFISTFMTTFVTHQTLHPLPTPSQPSRLYQPPRPVAFSPLFSGLFLLVP